MQFNAIIVDDEAMARLNLADSLSKYQNWQCVAEQNSGIGVLEVIHEFAPQVVFLDIKMPGQNGLEVAKSILELPQPPLIVFVTAFDQHALAAFDLYAVDYLLKPFSQQRFGQCIERLETLLTGKLSIKEQVENQTAFLNQAPIKKLVIKSASSIRLVEIATIEWIAACGNYLEIYHREGKHLFRSPLKQILNVLPQPEFIQVHRSHIVRVELVREFRSLHDERYELELSTGSIVPVGGLFKDALVKRLYQ